MLLELFIYNTAVHFVYNVQFDWDKEAIVEHEVYVPYAGKPDTYVCTCGAGNVGTTINSAELRTRVMLESLYFLVSKALIPNKLFYELNSQLVKARYGSRQLV